MKAINITAFTEDESQIEAIKAVIKAFRIKYSISSHDDLESTYSPDFVAMIRKGEKDLKKGRGIKMSINELEKLCK